MQVTSQSNNALPTGLQFTDANTLRIPFISAAPDRGFMPETARLHGGKSASIGESDEVRASVIGPRSRDRTFDSRVDAKVNIKGDKSTVDIDRGGKHWLLSGDPTGDHVKDRGFGPRHDRGHRGVSILGPGVRVPEPPPYFPGPHAVAGAPSLPFVREDDAYRFKA